MIRIALARFERGFTILSLVVLCSLFLPISRFQGGRPDDPGVSDPANRAVMVAVLVFSLVMLIVHARKMVPALASAWLPFAIVALAFLSSLWASTPDLVMRRAANFTGTTLFGVYLAARWRPTDIARMLVVAGFIMALGSWGLLAAKPGLAIMHEGGVAGSLRGAFSHKNMLGWMSGLIIITCFWAIGTGRGGRLAWFTVLLTIPLWIGARSMTAIGAVILTSLVCGAVMGLRTRPVTRVVWGYAMMAGGIVAISVVAVEGRLILEAMGRDASFTGRAPLWELLSRAIAERPLLGYGFQSFWQKESGWFERIAADVGWTVPTAHNGWIDVWLALGLVGLVLVAALVLSNLARASVAAARGLLPGAGLIFAVNVYLLVISFFESNLATPGIVAWALHVATAVMLARHSRVVARARARRGAYVWRLGAAPVRGAMAGAGLQPGRPTSA